MIASFTVAMKRHGIAGELRDKIMHTAIELAIQHEERAMYPLLRAEGEPFSPIDVEHPIS